MTQPFQLQNENFPRGTYLSSARQQFPAKPIAIASPSLRPVIGKSRSNSIQSFRGGERGLDGFTFFCANLQTGFGPFVAIYLTSQKWTQTDIGLVLMCGSLMGLMGQLPGGMLVDRARSKRLLTAVSVSLIGVSALILASNSLFITILFAWILHATASCMLSPAIGSMSLRLVGHSGISKRLGRNASFASIGGAIAAAGMGACGYYLSNRAVFLVTAMLVVPALTSLIYVKIEPDPSEADTPDTVTASSRMNHLTDVLRNKAILITAASIALFYLANAAMLPLIGSVLTLRSHSPTVFIAACIIIPQIMVALLSVPVAVAAQCWGRRPLMIICFIALGLRGLSFGFTYDPYLLAATQVLDGVSASILGILVPLIAADATTKRGGFAMAQGFLGTTMSLGAALSTTLAGFLSDSYGSQNAFLVLASIALVGVLAVFVFMPETKLPSE